MGCLRKAGECQQHPSGSWPSLRQGQGPAQFPKPGGPEHLLLLRGGRDESGRGEWVGRGFPRAAPHSFGSPIVALTKAALFLPTTIPCQHPSAFRLQISCLLAACQEANVDGKGIRGAGCWKGCPSCGSGRVRAIPQECHQQGRGVPRNVWILLHPVPSQQGPALGPQDQ